jgi:hypothetical protein
VDPARLAGPTWVAADVQDDQIGRLVDGMIEALLARPGDGDLIALLLKGVLDAAGDGVLVLDDQDRGCHAGNLHRGPRG